MRTSSFVKLCARNELGGIEFLSSIPGTIGGALIMNAGCQDYAQKTYKEIAHFVKSVDVVREGAKMRLMRNDIVFDYRSSSLQHSIILAACFSLEHKAEGEVLRDSAFNSQEKAKRIPWGQKNLGSMFKNPPQCEYTAGQLIEKSELKGMRRGDICISQQHANVFLNTGNGSSQDVWYLINHVRDIVNKKFGLTLELEIDYCE